MNRIEPAAVDGLLAAVGIKVKGRAPREVGTDIARIEQVRVVTLTVGAYDLELQVLARNLDELTGLLNEQIARIDGVLTVVPSLARQILKHEYDGMSFA